MNPTALTDLLRKCPSEVSSPRPLRLGQLGGGHAVPSSLSGHDVQLELHPRQPERGTPPPCPIQFNVGPNMHGHALFTFFFCVCAVWWRGWIKKRVVRARINLSAFPSIPYLGVPNEREGGQEEGSNYAVPTTRAPPPQCNVVFFGLAPFVHSRYRARYGVYTVKSSSCHSLNP